MKKIFFLFTMAVAAITTTSNAQDSVVVYPQETVIAVQPVVPVVVAVVEPLPDPRSRFYVGLKAGFNYARVYDSEGEDFEADGKSGFAGGIFLTIPIGKFLGIQPEVLFSQRGFKATGTLLGNPYTLTRTTNFIDVPLLIALKPAPFITILGGPQFSYLFKQRDEFKGSVNSVVEEEFKNDDFRKNMLCFIGGLDFNFNKIVIGTRVGWDIQNNVGDGSSTTPRYKNTWIQGTLGVRF